MYALQEPEGGSTETVIGLGGSDPADLLQVDQAAPQTLMDPAFAGRTALFRGNAAFRLSLKLAEASASGTSHLRILIRYQSCSDRLCLPPRTDEVARDVPVQR